MVRGGGRQKNETPISEKRETELRANKKIGPTDCPGWWCAKIPSGAKKKRAFERGEH